MLTGVRAWLAPHRFGFAVAGIVVLAFAVRVGFGLLVAPDLPPASDAEFYRDVAAHLADGDGFVADGAWLVFGEPGVPTPTAKHPPVFPGVLAIGNLVGLDTVVAQRVLLAALAALGVGLLAVAGRLLVEARVGIVAGLIAAVHPLWFQHAGMVVSESVYLVVLPALLVAAAMVLRRESTVWPAVLGIVLGIAVLTRVEAVVLVAFVVIPASLAGPGRTGRAVGVASLAAVAVVAPWVLRNADTVGSLVVSLNAGPTLAGANCDDVYSGDHLGGWSLGCAYEGAARAVHEEGAADPAGLLVRLRADATDYAWDHRSQVPAVVAGRLGRTLGVYDVDESITFDANEGRHRPTQAVGYVVNVVLLGAAAVGAVILAGRARPAVVLLGGLFASALLTGAAVYGSTRMRVAAEPALAILAATAVIGGLERYRARR